MFFALSGFLITTLLLEERTRYRHISLRFFWARRALRLFPALALLLLATGIWASIDHIHLAHETLVAIPWVGLYVGNWVAAFGHQTLGVLFHTWSLSVEEQFYVLWPLVVILVFRRSKRPLRTLLIVAIVGSALSLLVRFVVHVGPNLARTAGTDYRGDQLLLGCGLAVLFEMLPTVSLERLRRVTDVLFPIAVLFLAIVALGIVIPKDIPGQISVLRYELTLIALSSCVVIAHLVQRPTGSAGRLLSWRPAVYIGRISYGIYLWHIPVFRLLPLYVHTRPSVMLLLKLGITLGVAAASYRFLEQPMLRHKARFRPSRPAAVA